MNSFLKRFLGFFKGLLKGPSLRLGIISLVLITLAAVGSFFIPKKSSDEKEDFSLKAMFLKEDNPQAAGDSFLGPNKKAGSESPELLLVNNSSLMSVSVPTAFSPQVLGALVEGYDLEDAKKVVTEYVAEQGDTLASVAEKFNISLDTLLWANDLTKKSKLTSGDKLVILPVSGLLHHVTAGDVLSNISERYKVKTEDVIAFNDLTDENDVYVGDILVVPNGVMPPPATAPVAPQYVPLASSYFICPVAYPCRLTQRLHFYNAVDISHGRCGETIFAAAAGTVIKVKQTASLSRWVFGGAGNTIAIQHPNGVVTSYGHIAASLVSVGDTVYQGQPIALMGGQPGMPGAGMSTGCHVHFAVTGARNPFNR